MHSSSSGTMSPDCKIQMDISATAIAVRPINVTVTKRPRVLTMLHRLPLTIGLLLALTLASLLFLLFLLFPRLSQPLSLLPLGTWPFPSRRASAVSHPLALRPPPPPPPPYSCAAAWHTPPDSALPPCTCSIACESVPADAPAHVQCCPDLPRVTHALITHLRATRVIRGPAWRDLGNNMTQVWALSQWRRASWLPAGSVLAVGQACVRYPSRQAWRWECHDAADVVTVAAEVRAGWVDYLVTPFSPPPGKRVPSEVVVGLGAVTHPVPQDLFYVRFTHAASIAAVLKSITARLRYCGLTLGLDPRGRNGARDWDPTPGRDWHALSTSTYSLTRGGQSPIDADASPGRVDAEYENVVRESHGVVVPWLACHVRRVRLPGQGWVHVVDPVTGKWHDQEDDAQWFIS